MNSRSTLKYTRYWKLRDIEHMGKDGTHRRRKRGKADFEQEYWRMMLPEEDDLQQRLDWFERENLIPDYLRDIVNSRRGPGHRGWEYFHRALMNLPSQLKFNQRQFIHHHLQENACFKPLLISGDAGKGKTISISYFALEYVQTLEDLIENSHHTRWKHCNYPCSFEQAAHDRSEKIRSSNNLLPVLWNGLLSTSPDIIHHIDEAEFAELMHIGWISKRPWPITDCVPRWNGWMRIVMHLR